MVTLSNLLRKEIESYLYNLIPKTYRLTVTLGRGRSGYETITCILENGNKHSTDLFQLWSC